MMPLGHAFECGDAYQIVDGETTLNKVTVPGGAGEESPGVYDTPSGPLDIQKTRKLNLIVITQGSGAGDSESLLLHVQGRGRAGVWNEGLPVPIYIPVDGEGELASSVVVDVEAYQMVRIGKISNPNSGDVTVRVLGDYTC